MKFSLIARFLIALCFFISVEARAETPSQIPNPLQTRRSWVSDNANVISDADERRINAILSPLERKTGAEVAVVTVRNLGGQSVEEFANDLFRIWKIGKKGRDNGVVILAAIDDRKSRIDVDYGLQDILPDGKTGEILHEKVTPQFKNGAYGQGLYSGALAVAQVIDPSLATPADAATGSSPQSPASRPAQPASDGRFVPENSSPVLIYPSGGGGLLIAFSALLIFLFPLLMIGGVVWFFTAAMRRPLRCSKCRAPVQQLSETAELASLSPVQQFEQQIGARDYRVWRCQNCHNEDITAHDLPYSQFVQCPTCRHQTASSLVETVRHPTHWQGGLQRVILSCQWAGCKHSSFYNRPTPPTPRAGYSSGYGRGNGGTDLLTGIVLGSILGNSNSSGGGWSGGGWSGGGSGNDSGGSSGDVGGGFDSGPSDFGGSDSGGGGGGASDSW